MYSRSKFCLKKNFLNFNLFLRTLLGDRKRDLNEKMLKPMKTFLLNGKDRLVCVLVPRCTQHIEQYLFESCRLVMSMSPVSLFIAYLPSSSSSSSCCGQSLPTLPPPSLKGGHPLLFYPGAAEATSISLILFTRRCCAYLGSVAIEEDEDAADEPAWSIGGALTR